jgi:hypothetical protein
MEWSNAQSDKVVELNYIALLEHKIGYKMMSKVMANMGFTSHD